MSKRLKINLQSFPRVEHSAKRPYDLSYAPLHPVSIHLPYPMYCYCRRDLKRPWGYSSVTGSSATCSECKGTLMDSIKRMRARENLERIDRKKSRRAKQSTRNHFDR